MATMRLKEFRCVEETDESGSDSPYFLVFHGRVDAPEDAELAAIRSSSWDDEIDSNDFRSVGAVVAKNVTASSVAVVILLEEDAGPDFVNSAEFAAMRSGLKYTFETYIAGGMTDTKALGWQIAYEAGRIHESEDGNDELVDAERIRITTLGGALPLLHLHGDGGYYKVRFVTS